MVAIGSSRPATTLRCGNIKETIWQNISENGPFFATTFSRRFNDQTGEWRNGISFGLNNLEALMNVAFEAKEWITAHTQALSGLYEKPSGGLIGAFLLVCPVSVVLPGNRIGRQTERTVNPTPLTPSISSQYRTRPAPVCC